VRRLTLGLMLAVGTGLVAVAVLTVSLLLLLRGQSRTAQPDSPLVSQSPATVTSQPTALPTADASPPPVLGQVPGASGAPGSPSLLPPLPRSASIGLPSPLSPPQAGQDAPPFLTASAVRLALDAIVAAAAVRNGPAQAAAPPASAAVVSRPVTVPQPPVPQPNLAPAGRANTSRGGIAPIAGGRRASTGGTVNTTSSAPLPHPAPPTPTQQPNHIAVPSGPIAASDVAPTAGATRTPGVHAAGPNRIGPPPIATR
jgi:hypothetical protein